VQACLHSKGTKKWLTTPEGWARANILFQTLREPPPRGSVRESLLRLLVMQKEEAEHAKFRALAQLLVDKEAGAKAFEEYFDAAFPHIKKEMQETDMSLAKFLHREVERGGLAVRRIDSGRRVHSRLRVKYNKGSAEMADKVMTRIGTSMRVP